VQSRALIDIGLARLHCNNVTSSISRERAPGNAFAKGCRSEGQPNGKTDIGATTKAPSLKDDRALKAYAIASHAMQIQSGVFSDSFERRSLLVEWHRTQT